MSLPWLSVLAVAQFFAAEAAAEPTAAGDPTSLFSWAQYGVLGLLILAMIFGKIVPGYILQQREKELADTKAELSALRKNLEETVIPALVRSTDILARMAEEGRGK